MASWIIGYGFIQTIAPRITGHSNGKSGAVFWAAVLAVVPAAIAGALMAGWSAQAVVIGGLLLFGVLFAINSSLHSYLIVSYARGDGVSLDVGFYYMSNAAGRLLGTILSGWVYQAYGLEACLWISAALVATAALLSVWLPERANKPIGEKGYV
jgi:predicted MFS family arabinose efflux permease